MDRGPSSKQRRARTIRARQREEMPLTRFTSVRVPRPEETRCVHGSYVGYPGGPDYMCGRCEMGETTLSLCSDCGAEFWTDGAKRGTCEPNPARAKLADSLWQLRRAIPNSRKLVRHMRSIASEWSIKRRVHGMGENIGEDV